MKFLGVPLEPSSLDVNPTLDELRSRSFAFGAVKTATGAIAVFPKVKSRLEDKTKVFWSNPGKSDLEEIQAAFAAMSNRPLVELDRLLGEGDRYHCRLYISAAYPQPALVWGGLLIPTSPTGNPDFVAVSIPEFPRQHVYIFPRNNPPLVVLLGVDYGGEHKMAFLRQYLYRAKRDGKGLGLHAALTTFFLDNGLGDIPVRHAAFLANSGTGKSTLSSYGYGCRPSNAERVAFRQDDIIKCTLNGEAFGTEQERFYIIVANLNKESQPNLWAATRSPETIFENVRINAETGEPDFSDLSLSKNPRAAVRRADIANAAHTSIDAPRLDFIFLVTRDFSILPPVLRLSPERAAYEFMAGRTVETAAANPGKIGATRRIVGFNPFIMGTGKPERYLAEEGNIFFNLVRRNNSPQVFLINTGSIGGKKDGGLGDIRMRDSTHIIREIICDRVGWRTSVFGVGYEEPEAVMGLDMMRFSVTRHYTPSEFEALLAELRQSDREWMEQFRGHLAPEVMALLQ